MYAVQSQGTNEKYIAMMFKYLYKHTCVYVNIVLNKFVRPPPNVSSLAY